MGLIAKSIQSVGGVGGLIGDGINVVAGMSDYNMARQKGNSKALSLGKAVGSFIFYEALGPWAIPYTLATVAPQLIGAAGQHQAKIAAQAYNMRGKIGSGHFEMSNAGYTMRQRSLNAIRNNGINTQSALGNEARTYYRGSI